MTRKKILKEKTCKKKEREYRIFRRIKGKRTLKGEVGEAQVRAKL